MMKQVNCDLIMIRDLFGLNSTTVSKNLVNVGELMCVNIGCEPQFL